MGLALWRTAAIVCSLLLSIEGLAQPIHVSAEYMGWPAKTQCSVCAPLQFGELSMRIPLDQIEKIAVLGSDLSALHLVPKGKAEKALISLISLPRDAFVGRYEQGKLIAQSPALTNKALLDLMFSNSRAAIHPYAIHRKIEGIDRASALRIASRDGLHLYWIKRNRPEIDHVYVVADGSETTYMIAGEISDELFNGIVSNMRRERVP